MALQIQNHLRPIHPKTLVHSSLLHLFSTNSNPPPDPNDQTIPTTSNSSSFSSYFNDVKASLKHQDYQKQQGISPPGPRRPSFPSASFPTSKASASASIAEIQKNLSEFRRRSSAPPPTGPNSPTPFSALPSSSSPQISFQELSKKNATDKPNEYNTAYSFDAIRESLRHLKSSNERRGGAQSMSLSAFKDTLKLKPSDSSPASAMMIGGTDRLPAQVFGKEMRERKEGESAVMKTEFVKMYSHAELGEKLRKLRPEEEMKKGGGWFSLNELNERLMKLREMEEKETESRIGGVAFKDLRDSLVRMKMSNDEKAKKSPVHRLDFLSQIGRTPSYMLQPPKEHLIEQYFHPDNMSSADKLKIELAKVRDEFKMSESDCGSARVQVAQLTTKIKHLSKVLHKKDKHSKKGLLAMVQQRKKLLKYLRRTDWDSYTLVLSRLGLRDNPDYKH